MRRFHIDARAAALAIPIAIAGWTIASQSASAFCNGNLHNESSDEWQFASYGSEGGYPLGGGLAILSPGASTGLQMEAGGNVMLTALGGTESNNIHPLEATEPCRFDSRYPDGGRVSINDPVDGDITVRDE